MAFCPKCQSEMGMADVACMRCGYDFVPKKSIRRPGLAYTKLADVALMAGTIGAGLACIAVVVMSVANVIRGDWAAGLVGGPLAFMMLLAVLVVFLRVQDM